MRLKSSIERTRIDRHEMVEQLTEMTRYLLAHDLGTSGNKATLFTEDGRLIGSRVTNYPTAYFNINWAEQEPEDWWTAVCTSTRELVTESRIDPSAIVVVSFSGHMMGCLCLNQDGKPLRQHILWADQRAQPQSAQLAEKITHERFYQITGHRNNPSYGLQKLMWVRDHEPAVYAATASVVNAKDWLVFRLTGKLYTEFSDASGMGCMDLQQLKWSEEIITAAGIDGSKLPALVPSTYVAGGVTAEAAAATGLAPGTPVVMGGGDGVCATVGAGCVREGAVYCVIGSSSWVSFAADRPLYDRQLRTFSWAHIVPGLFCPCGTMQAAGGSYSWLKREIATSETEQAAREGISAYDLMSKEIASARPGANGVIFLPYLMGERAPRWNSDAKGAFIGLKMETRRCDILRSVLEGVTMNMRIIIDAYRDNGYPLNEIRVIGGGAKDDVWCQIMADIWEADIVRLSILEEATSMGAAVTGGVGVGLYADFDAINRFIAPERTFHPDPEAVEAYQPVRRVFDQCYQALEPVFPQFNALAHSN